MFRIPRIHEQFGDEEFYFQQNGAPPHYHRDVRACLDENLPNWWIGRRGSIEFLPHSPDLTPLDFFYGDTSKIRFIAQNLQQSISWEQQLKENAPKYQMKWLWFVIFAIPSVRIISSAWTRTVISSNTCDSLQHLSSLTWIIKHRYILINIIFIIIQTVYTFFWDTLY